MADLFVRGVFAEPYDLGRPMKFKGRDIPEYFKAYFYVIDNDGYKVKKANFKKFKTVRYDLVLRVTAIETIEMVSMSVEGARPYKGHIFLTTEKDDLSKIGSLQPKYLNQFYENRTKFITVATQEILSSSKPIKTKTGFSWTIGDKTDITEGTLREIYEHFAEPTHRKLDGSFYQNFADRYRELVNDGDKTPIKSMRDLYYPEKTVKHVQTYATKARKLGLLPKTSSGRNSPVRKTRKKG